MATRRNKPRGASEQEPTGRVDDRDLEAGPGAGNEPVLGGGPGKVQDGDLQMRTGDALAGGDEQKHQENLVSPKDYPMRPDPHERLRKIVEARKAREKKR
jgi:hypothetical protein